MKKAQEQKEPRGRETADLTAMYTANNLIPVITMTNKVTFLGGYKHVIRSQNKK